MNAPLDIKELREVLNLTQAEMADLLCVNRGQVSMNESGLRALPARAMIRINRINEILISHAVDPETEFIPESPTAKLETLLATYRLQKIILDKNRQAMKRVGERTGLLRKLLQHFDEMAMEGYKSEKDLSWKNRMEASLDADVPDVLHTFLSRMELAVVELRIAMLESEIQRSNNATPEDQ